MIRTVANVGCRKQLLFDDVLVEKKTGFALTMNPAERMGEPVLVPEMPWEVGGICGDSNLSVIDDDGTYRMWYAVEYFAGKKAPGKSSKIRGVDQLDAKTLADLRGAERKYVLCYATSTDGIHWQKPALGLIQYQGSKQNNMVFRDRLGCTVFKAPTAPASERFKMIYGGGPRLPHVHLAEDIPVRKIYHGVYGAASPDGVRWRRYRAPIMPWYTDTTNVAYWDGRLGKYVAFVRSNEGMVFQDGKTVTPDKGSRLRYRAIARTESEDFRRFPPPTRIMEPTVDERKQYGTGVDYYNSAAMKYAFAADSYFLFSSNFYHEPDTLDVHLCTSRDGVHYVRWHAPFVGVGLAGNFDSQCVYMGTGMIRRGGWLLMYYAGYDVPHGRGAQKKPHSGGIGLARIRLDGFVSQDARWQGGKLVTVPLKFEGRRLEVNMDANAGGCLKVEVLDAQGRTLPGFARRDADWLWGNGVAQTVTWKSQSGVSRLAGRRVRLRFVGKGVKLYAFQFVR